MNSPPAIRLIKGGKTDANNAPEALYEALAGDGDGPHDGGMEHRVTALETRLDTILPTLATKADIGEVRSDIKGWMLGTVLTIIVTVVGTIVALNTLFKASAIPPQQAPTIIQVPAYPPAAPAKTNQDGTKNQPGTVKP